MLFQKHVTWGIILLSFFLLLGCAQEIREHETVTRRGLLYKMGENEPFSGIVTGRGRETYHTRLMKFRKVYKDGLLDGETLFYYPNGKVESQVPYIQGKINGSMMRYWSNGKPRARIHFDHGMRGGARGEMFWDKNGHQIRS